MNRRPLPAPIQQLNISMLSSTGNATVTYPWQDIGRIRSVQHFSEDGDLVPLQQIARFEIRLTHFQAQGLELEPENVVVNMNLARMLKKKGDLRSAKVFAERALLLDPHYEAARGLLAQLSE